VETTFLSEKKKISYNTKIYTAMCVVLIAGSLLSVVFLNGLLASFDSVSQSETAPARVSHWSGYIISLDLQNKSEGVSSISGTWTVPEIAYSENNTYSSVWVGVGGYGEKTLIQAGTEQHCENGRISYFAWYELLPASITTEGINLDIQPGDRVTTSITLVNEEKGSWLITIVDETEGRFFQITVDYPQSTRKTAEWIVERPTVNGKISTLADFNQVTLTDCTTTINGVTGSIQNFTFTKAVMVGSLDNDLVQTSTLGSDGSSFTVTYLKPNQTTTSPNA
jgi:Peptidase A4 family